MERTPSFLVANFKRERDQTPSTPTGCTPLKKRQRHGSPFSVSSLTKKKSAWTPQSKASLQKAVEEARYSGLDDSTSDFWDFVSKNISSSITRSGESCRLFYRRNYGHKDKENQSLDSKPKILQGRRRLLDLGSENICDVNPLSVDVHVQTDLSIPPENIPRKTLESESATVMPKPKEYLACDSDAAQLLHKENVKRLHMFVPLPDDVRTKLIGLLIDNPSVNLVEELWDTEFGKNMIMETVLNDIENSTSKLCKHPHRYDISKSSTLFENSITDLTTFDWKKITQELIEKQSTLFQILLTVLIPKSAIGSKSHTYRAVQKICLVYAVLLQNRNKDMSLVQRLIASLLESQHVHQQVYDMLQPMGLTLGHSGMLHLVKLFKGHFNTQIINNIQLNKRLRLVGDNVDVKIGTKHERLQKHDHLEHWFGSLAIFDEPIFINCSSVKPRGNLLTTDFSEFLLNEIDITKILINFAVHVGRIAAENLQYFKFLHKVLPKYILGEYSNDLSKKSDVVPLECIPYNETSYADCIKIMEYYQDSVDKWFSEANMDIPLSRIHIGGDQKTRERFSGTKSVVAGSLTSKERFEGLGPVTFEFFHLKMKVLDVIYKVLYKVDSDDLGTMEAEKVRLSMKSVDPKVKDHYDSDRDFFHQFFTAYMIEALMSYFGMDTVDSVPKYHIPSNMNEMNDDEIKYWYHSTIRNFFETHMFHSFEYGQKHQSKVNVEKNVYIQMPDGTVYMQNMTVVEEVENDYVYNYGRNVLELGLLFQELEDCCKLPDRSRLLSIMKYLMVLLRGHNTMAKYNLEILRFLIHQLVTLSEREANECLYSLFVNTKGGVDTHVPADQVMEHNVRTVKTTISALGSNKINHEVIRNRTAAEPAFKEIENNFCRRTKTLVRSQKHKTPDASNEIMLMVRDIHKANPFGIFMPGRQFEKFKSMKYSLISQCNYESLKNWIEKNKRKYFYEIGQ